MIKVPNKSEYFSIKQVCILLKIQALCYYTCLVCITDLFGDDRSCVFGRMTSVVRLFYLLKMILKEELL